MIKKTDPYEEADDQDKKKNNAAKGPWFRGEPVPGDGVNFKYRAKSGAIVTW